MKVEIYALFAYVTGALIFVAAANAEEPPIAERDSGAAQGKITTIENPVQSCPRPALGTVKEMCATPDAKRVVVDEWLDGPKLGNRVIVINVASGKIERTLAHSDNQWDAKQILQRTARGVVVRNGDDEFTEYDPATGAVIRNFMMPKEKKIVNWQFASDANSVALGTEDPGAVVTDLKSGQSKDIEFPFLPAKMGCLAFRLRDTSRFLVVSCPDSGKKESNVQKNRLDLFDAATKKAVRLTRFEGNCDVHVAADGKRAYIFRQEDPQEVAWTSIEKWNLDEGKLIKKMPLKPAVASIGLKFSEDGKTLFLHEDEVQTILVWNLDSGRLVGQVAPEGCEQFDVTPDGKKLVAFVGEWKNGSLEPKTLAVYDTSGLVAEKQAVGKK